MTEGPDPFDLNSLRLSVDYPAIARGEITADPVTGLYMAYDREACEIGKLYRKAKASMADSVHCWLECGTRLIGKKESLGHGNWLPWIERNEYALGFGERAARYLMKAAEANRQLASDLEPSEALKICRQIWGHSGNYLAQGTGENEWFTPEDIVERVRLVLGEIDLDPASSMEANDVVGAVRYFTAADDGLAQEWHGRVWLNPPYSRELMPAFVKKLIEEFDAGRTTQAILVSHNNTETGWFQALAVVASAICFPDTRIRFYRGENVAAPVNGQVFFYLGAGPENFVDFFRDLGVIVRHVVS